MKRLLTTAAAALLAFSVNAQIVSTTSNSSHKSTQIVSSYHQQEGGDVRWFVKAGLVWVSGTSTSRSPAPSAATVSYAKSRALM